LPNNEGVFRDILVAFDGSPAARVAFEQAVDLARTQNAKLTVLTVAPPVGSFSARAGVDPVQMREELDEWATRLAREAAGAAPDDVIVHHVARNGHAGEEIVKELGAGTYDLIVLGSRGRGRVESNLLGTVNGYVHFHSKVALLSIQGPVE
jgi:nucleotide-binding universal stress UspA family protein